MSLAARLRVYAPDGAATGFLLSPESWSASLPVNDLAALTLSYPAAAEDAGLLGGPCEVAVEINPGTGWVEPRNARYMLLESAADRAKRAADMVSYTMPGYARLLEGVVVVPAKYGAAANYDADGKRKFLSASVGTILTDLLGEARDLVAGLTPGLSLGFSATQDSLGSAWAKRVTIYYEPGLSLWTVLDNLAQQGMCDWWMEGRTLRVVNSEAGVVHTGIRLMGEATEAPVRASLAGLLHTAFLVGDEETWRVDNPTAPTPWGTSMKVLTQGGVRDEGTALTLIDAELSAGSAERVEYTRSAALAGEAKLPLVDFQLRDYVWSTNKTGTLEEMRVFQITLSFGGDGLDAALTLNDRFVDAQVRAAKRTKGIVNGASGDAGTGVMPTPTSPEAATPSAPAGLVLAGIAYIDVEGRQRGLVSATWDAVTTTPEGEPVSVASYELRWREDFADAPWNPIESLTTTTAISPLPVNVMISVKVRAIAGNGQPSKWSILTMVTVPLDTTPPPVPAAPTLTVSLGTVTVGWNGENSAGGSMPLDFHHTEVERESKGIIGALTATSGGNFLVVTDQTYGAPERYRLVAVDNAGNRSAPSTWASATTAPLVEGNIDPAIITKLNHAKAEAEAAQLTANEKNQVVRSHLPASGTGYTPGDIWWRYADETLTGPILDAWVYTADGWEPSTIAGEVIAYLTVDKLRVTDTGTFDDLVVADLFSNSAVIELLISQGIIVVHDPDNPDEPRNLVTGTIIGPDEIDTPHLKTRSVKSDNIEVGALKSEHHESRSIETEHLALEAVDRSVLASDVEAVLEAAEAWADRTELAPGVITITSGSNTLNEAKMRLTATRLSFRVGSTEVAYIDSAEQAMKILRAVIGESITVGRHKIESYNSEITLFRWVG